MANTAMAEQAPLLDGLRCFTPIWGHTCITITIGGKSGKALRLRRRGSSTKSHAAHLGRS